MFDRLKRPVRGGLPIAIALLILGGATILAMAPGRFRDLPIVRYFAEWSPFELRASLAAALVLIVTGLAFRKVRRDRQGTNPAGPGRCRWTAWRFAAALVLTPPVIFLGAMFTRGFDGVLVGSTWQDLFLAVEWLLGGFWLASAFHAFRGRWRTVLWVIAGVAIALSIRSVKISDFLLGDPFGEVANARVAGGPEYLLCSRVKVRLPGFDFLVTDRIGRVRRRLFDVTWYETLAETQTAVTDCGVYPEFGRLVRPEGFSGGFGSFLYASEDGFVASIHFDMECALACDTVTGEVFGEWHAREWGARGGQPEVFERKGMNALPPFRLVEAGGRPAPGDVSLLEDEASRRAKERLPGASQVWYSGLEGLGWATSEKAMLHALDSRNDLVRAAAERIIRAGGKAVYPEAFERLR